VVGCIAAELWFVLGLKRDMVETLSSAGLFVLLTNPISLFCVGFQLSFLACFGIAFLARPIQVWLERIFVRENTRPLMDRIFSLTPNPSAYKENKVISFLSVTFAAQLATAPVLYAAFGYLSVWGLLLNCLLVPCVAWVFSCTLLFSSIACALPAVLSKIILLLPNLVWALIATFFQVLDFSYVFVGKPLQFGAVLAYYVALVFLSDKLNLSKRNKAVGAAAFFACFVVGCFL
jgi:competence protein ComEC